MRRAAWKVLSEAVRREEPIPLADGDGVVWKVPKEALAALDAAMDAAGDERPVAAGGDGGP